MDNFFSHNFPRKASENYLGEEKNTGATSKVKFDFSLIGHLILLRLGFNPIDYP